MLLIPMPTHDPICAASFPDAFLVPAHPALCGITKIRIGQLAVPAHCAVRVEWVRIVDRYPAVLRRTRHDRASLCDHDMASAVLGRMRKQHGPPDKDHWLFVIKHTHHTLPAQRRRVLDG